MALLSCWQWVPSNKTGQNKAAPGHGGCMGRSNAPGSCSQPNHSEIHLSVPLIFVAIIVLAAKQVWGQSLNPATRESRAPAEKRL